MSDSEDKSSKTEEASEQKLRKSLEQGQTWSTREPGHAMAYLAILTVITLVAPATLPLAVQRMAAIFDLGPQMQIETSADLGMVLSQMAWAAATAVLPALMVLLVAGICAAVLSGPFVVSLKRIEPKISKINPMSGFKKIFSVNNLVEFAKSLTKLVLIAVLMLMILRAAMEELLPAGVLLPETLLSFVASSALQGLAWIVAIMIPIVIFDIFWKRRDFLKNQRQSKKDQRDEHKDSEGDPQIRARRQEIGRRRLRQNLKKAVPEATLVVMNPTHYAVALRYERGKDHAPVCIAKGADLIALNIKALALEHEVPVIESPPLARALHAVVEVDSPIPEEHWAAVAELVGYVLDLRHRVRRKLPEGSHHLRH